MRVSSACLDAIVCTNLNNYYICYYWDESKILETTTIIANYRHSIYRIAAVVLSRNTSTAAAPSSEQSALSGQRLPAVPLHYTRQPA